MTRIHPPLRDARGRVDLRSLDLAGIESLVAGLGKERYRALQIFKWVWQKGIRDFSEMTNISRDFSAALAERAFLSRLELAVCRRSADGTRKFAWKLDDGRFIESVLIPEDDRLTLCVSSQVGCAMGCRFCLTADLGLVRHLRPSEIALQPLQVQEHLEPGERISNIVLMGMGEPLHNFDAMLTALAIMLAENGLNFSHRRITVSTSGLAPRLMRLGELSPVNLAVSLNATTNELRTELMPVNRAFDIGALIAACRRVRMPHGKRISFEYVLFGGLNDSLADAARLVRLLHGVPAKVNLIPYNENPARAFVRPAEATTRAFQDYVVRRGIQTSVRVTRGLDIEAACGQLGRAMMEAGTREDPGALESELVDEQA
jgi:23S rRNA (adenine2503-C2)-methyltransferase